MEQSTSPVVHLQRLLGAFTLLLVGVSWPLWLPPKELIGPQIPWFGWLCDTPAWVDLVGLTLLCVSSCGLLIGRPSGQFRSIVPAVYWASLVCLLMLDQHRLQPWAWQYFLLASLLLISPDAPGLRCCQWVVMSIYFHSALSKFDLAFFDVHGQMLLDGLTTALHLDTEFWTPNTRRWIAAGFPAGEFVVAVLLLFKTTRRLGLYCSWGMHLALFATLGPWGLNHEWGVLIWNIFFLLQNGILFGRNANCDFETPTKLPGVQPADDARSETLPTELHTSVTPHDRSTLSQRSMLAIMRTRFIYTFTTLVAMAPFLENFGLYDHWPAWAVYSPRPEQVTIQLDEMAAAQLPESVAQFLGSPQPLTSQRPWSLDRWSFETRNCPVYPQLRYRLAAIEAILRPLIPSQPVEIQIRLSPDRLSAEREVLELSNWDELDAFQERFWINSEPRVASAMSLLIAVHPSTPQLRCHSPVVTPLVGKDFNHSPQLFPQLKRH